MGIVRVFVLNFEVILFDELMFVLDFELVGEVLFVICKIVEEGIIMIIVMYEMSFVCEVFNYVVFMDGGKIVE